MNDAVADVLRNQAKSLLLGAPTAPEQVRACATIASAWRDMSRSQRESFAIALEDAIGMDPSLDLAILSTLFNAAPERRRWSNLREACERMDGPAGTLHALLWRLCEAPFPAAAQEYGDEEGLTLLKWTLYRRILAAVRSGIDFDTLRDRQECQEADHVVMIAQQLLGVRHSPTAWLFDFALSLKRQFGKRVTIFNAAVLPTGVEVAIYPVYTYNYSTEYSVPGEHLYRGESFPVYQRPDSPLTITAIQECCEQVSAMRPSIAFSVGSTNIVADALAELMTVVHLPTGAHLPMQSATLSIVLGGLTDSDRELVATLGLDTGKLLAAPVTHVTPESNSVPLDKGSLSIPEDAFALVVCGNRLDSEIDPQFTGLLREVLVLDDRVFVLLAGRFDDFGEWSANAAVDSARVRYCGYQTDVMAFYAACDAYLNPFRSGGGASAAYAMSVGLPVVTLGHGDVGLTVGTRLSCGSPEEMKDMIARLVNDPEYYKETARLHRQRFHRDLSDRGQVLSMVYDRLTAMGL